MSLPTRVTNLKEKGKKKKNPVEKKILEPFRDIIRKRPEEVEKTLINKYKPIYYKSLNRHIKNSEIFKDWSFQKKIYGVIGKNLNMSILIMVNKKRSIHQIKRFYNR